MHVGVHAQAAVLQQVEAAEGLGHGALLDGARGLAAEVVGAEDERLLAAARLRAAGRARAAEDGAERAFVVGVLLVVDAGDAERGVAFDDGVGTVGVEKLLGGDLGRFAPLATDEFEGGEADRDRLGVAGGPHPDRLDQVEAVDVADLAHVVAVGGRVVGEAHGDAHLVPAGALAGGVVGDLADDEVARGGFVGLLLQHRGGQRDFVLVVLVDRVDGLVEIEVFIFGRPRDAAALGHVLGELVLGLKAVQLGPGVVAAEALLHGGALRVKGFREDGAVEEEDVVVVVVVVVARGVAAGAGDLGVEVGVLLRA